MFRLTLSRKLPLLVVGLSLVAAGITGTIAFYQAQSALSHAAESRMSGLRDARRFVLQGYMDHLATELHIIASNPTVVRAVSDFSQAIHEVGPEQFQEIVDSFVTDNPYPDGEGYELLSTGSTDPYTLVHQRDHPWLRQFVADGIFDDVYLIDASGQIVYTAAKHGDLGHLMSDEEIAERPLAHAFMHISSDPHRLPYL
ncbi:MAG: cache domain-containing protein, partial [Rhodospirillaceae bacterium]|nr:cache domain-containing protein [Rhodospirillaceae bacterium]